MVYIYIIRKYKCTLYDISVKSKGQHLLLCIFGSINYAKTMYVYDHQSPWMTLELLHVCHRFKCTVG